MADGSSGKSAAKWTKKDVRTLADQMQSFHTMERMYAPPEAIQKHVETRTLDVVVGGLEGFASMLERRAKQSAETAAHFTAHPNIYGASTPEMVARFDGMAKDDAKDAKSCRALAARVKAEGVPPEALEIYRKWVGL